MSAWVFLLLGGMDSIVFGPIRWCVWSFRPSSPLRLPHLKFLFVCLFVCLDTPISLLLVICLLVLLFAVSVVGCLLGYSSCLVVWIPLFLDPSDGAFGRFDLAALCGCRTLNFCLFVILMFGHCIQLAGSLFQCWSSMLPSAFVSVDNATSLVVLMWWTCQTSCFRKISV